MEMKTLFMSIREEAFNAIIDGRKKHEFRRRFVNINEDFQVIFYINDPVKKIAGVILFGPVIKDNIDKIANLVRNHNYRTPELIKEYLKGLNEAYALPVKSVILLKKPIPLDKIQKEIKGFKPPQGFVYLDDSEKYKFIKDEVFKQLKIK